MKKLLALGIATLILSGCMSTTIKPEAFGAAKRYGVITITGNTEITDIKNNSSSGSSGSLTGLIAAAASKDINFSEKSDKILKKTQSIMDTELRAAKGFKYVGSAEILNSNAYKAAKGSEPKFGIFTIGLAEGYKYFKEEDQAQVNKIIKENRLDGAIVVNTAYNYGTGGVNIGGLVSVGSTKAIVSLSVGATDKKGNVVWQQHIQKQSEEGIANVGGAPNFVKLYPLLEQTAHDAFKEAVATLDTTVIAKK